VTLTLAGSLNTGLQIVTTWKFFTDYWQHRRDRPRFTREGRQHKKSLGVRVIASSNPSEWVTTGSAKEARPSASSATPAKGGVLVVDRGHGGSGGSPARIR
jgi:hypothetical protein